MLKRLILTGLVFIIGIGLFGEAKESGIKLITVYEKTFPDTIVDVIFDTVTVSISEAKAMGWKEEFMKIKKGKVQVVYPKVLFKGRGGSQIPRSIIFNGEIVFLSREGKVLKRVSVSRDYRLLWSENGRYILKAKDYNEFDESQQGAVLYNWDGKVIWEKNEGIFTAVSNDGYTATGFVSPTGAYYPFIIYDTEGKKVKKLNVDYKSWTDAVCSFSNKFLIVGSVQDLYIYNHNGEIVFQKTLNSWFYPDEVSVLNDSTFILVERRTKLTQRDTFIIVYNFINEDNSKEKRIPSLIPLIGNISFFKDYNIIFAYTSEGDLIEIENFEIKNQFKIDRNLKIQKDFAIKIDKNKIYIISLKEVER